MARSSIDRRSLLALCAFSVHIIHLLGLAFRAVHVRMRDLAPAAAALLAQGSGPRYHHQCDDDQYLHPVLLLTRTPSVVHAVPHARPDRRCRHEEARPEAFDNRPTRRRGSAGRRPGIGADQLGVFVADEGPQADRMRDAPALCPESTSWAEVMDTRVTAADPLVDALAADRPRHRFDRCRSCAMRGTRPRRREGECPRTPSRGFTRSAVTSHPATTAVSSTRRAAPRRGNGIRELIGNYPAGLGPGHPDTHHASTGQGCVGPGFRWGIGVPLPQAGVPAATGPAAMC